MEWTAISHRAKDFVRSLLVLDEKARMTAEQALEHQWFMDQVSREILDDLYQRTIRGWVRRVATLDMIEYLDDYAKAADSSTVRSLPRFNMPVLM